VQQFGWWGFTLGRVGLSALWQEGRKAVLFLVAVFFSYSVYAVGYDTTDSQAYLIPAFLAFAVWLSCGLAFLVDELQRRIAPSASRFVRALPLCLALLIPLVPLVGNFNAMDLSANHEAREYGLTVLEAVEPEAIVISATDAHTFSLWYLRYAERQRMDVAVLDSALLHYPWYWRTAAETHPRLGLLESETVVGGDPSGTATFSLAAFVEEYAERYAVYLTDPDSEMRNRFVLSESGPVYRVVGPGGG
jgi:hypothetical protein